MSKLFVNGAVLGVVLSMSSHVIAQPLDAKPVKAQLPAAPPLAETPVLEIKADQVKGKVSPYLYGIMTENINYCYDGGLYAEMIRNRNFKEMLSGLPKPSPDPSLLEVRRGRSRVATPGTNPPVNSNAALGARPGSPNAPATERRSSPAGGTRRNEGLAFWRLIQTGGGTATMEADASQPLNKACVNSLKLTVISTGPDQKVGVANEGYWGMGVRPNTEYKATIWAKAGNGFSGPITVALASADGKTVYAQAVIKTLGNEYKRYQATLTTAASVPETKDASFQILAGGKGTVWFSFVSLFPPTYKGHGLRQDIMQLSERDLAEPSGHVALQARAGNSGQGRVEPSATHCERAI